MSSKRGGLGRGLGALISEAPVASPPETEERDAVVVAIHDISLNPSQPRKKIQPGALADLVNSVREVGVLQPLLVRPHDGQYELIAGERRLTAARKAGLTEVPVVVRDVTDQEALELALVENLQREDLNPVEEAEGYQALCERFSLTQEQVAQRVGKARATVANSLRLLNLPSSLRSLLEENKISLGHAKVLLSLDIEKEQELLSTRILKEGLSVRETEKIIGRMKRGPKKPRARREDVPQTHIRYLCDRLQQHLGTAVRISPSATLANGKKAKGKIEIEYYSSEDLDRMLALFGLHEEL